MTSTRAVLLKKKLSILSPENTVLQRVTNQSYIGVKLQGGQMITIPGNEVVLIVNLPS
jgi:hypothetical protein